MNLKPISAALLVTAAAAVIPVPTPTTAAAPAAVDAMKQCFSTDKVAAFEWADEKTVYIRVNVNDTYRINLAGPCEARFMATDMTLKGPGSACTGLGIELSGRSLPTPATCAVESFVRMTAVEVSAMPNRYRP